MHTMAKLRTQVVAYRVLAQRRIDPDRDRNKVCDDERDQAELQGHRPPDCYVPKHRRVAPERGAEVPLQESAHPAVRLRVGPYPASVLGKNRYVEPVLLHELAARLLQRGLRHADLLHLGDFGIHNVAGHEPDHDEYHEADDEQRRNGKEEPSDDVGAHAVSP